VARVAAGYYHTLFVKTNGTLWAMGYNEHAELGDGTTTNRNTPVQVAAGVYWVSAGGYHSMWVGGLASQVPAITQQPLGATNQVGTTATFAVMASGATPLSYQWHKDGTNLLDGGRFSGVTNATLIISNAQPTDSGYYSVEVSNYFGSVTSSNAILMVNATSLQPVIQVNDGGFGMRSNHFCFNVCAVVGQAVVIEASTNLINWIPLQTNLTTSIGQFLFADAGSGRYPRRFYRARLYQGTLPMPAIGGSAGSMGFQSGHFGFNLSGVAGQTVVIEASTNLVNWSVLSTNTLGSDPLYFSDPDSAGISQRFYRARLWP
jgi:hypothetical protein